MADNLNSSIDDILSSLSEENEYSGTPGKTWSMSEIDELLGIKSSKSDDESMHGSHKKEDLVFSEKKFEEVAGILKADLKADRAIEYEPKLMYEPDAGEADVEETAAEEEPNSDTSVSDRDAKSDSEETDADKALDVDKKPDEKSDEKEDFVQEEIHLDGIFTKKRKKSSKKQKPAVDQKTKVFHAEDLLSAENEKNAFASENKDNFDETAEHVASEQDTPEESSMIMELADNSDEVEKTDDADADADAEVDEKDKDTEKAEKTAEKMALAQKTVGISPVRNENIEHQILTEKIEKSVGGMENDKYRRRFLNKPKQKLERTVDYERLHQDDQPEPIERPGMIIKKSKFNNTADLEPIPTIISADAELNSVDKTIVAKGGTRTIKHEDEDGIDGQIKLSGFYEDEEIEQIDEEHAEEKLREKRERKVAAFKLDPNFAELEEEIDAEEDEYTYSPTNTIISGLTDSGYENALNRNHTMEALTKASRNTAICGIIQGVLAIVALIVTSLIHGAGGNLEVIGGNAAVSCILNLALLLVAAVCGVSTLTRGVSGIINKKPNASTGTLLVLATCLFEIVAVTVSDDTYTAVPLYTAAGCLALAFASLARWLSLSRAKGNFRFITSGTGLYSTEKIKNEDEAFEIGRGLLIGDPEICYNAKLQYPAKFIENSFEDDPADLFAPKIIYSVSAVAVLAALILGIINKSGVVFFGTLAAVFSLGIPAFTLIASNISIFVFNKTYNRTGAAIVGHRAIAASTDINAFVLDSTDIFKKGSCNIIGIKTFHNMRIDDAILYAAALVIESGGPLADIFGNVILGKRELLPPVESLAYEERLGLSSWIHGRRILLGSRDLLINHNVEVPERDFELQYTHDGRKVMYLAIAGKVAAMFVIKYQADKHMRRYLQNVEKAGVSLLVRSCDCNITEEMICRYFSIPISAVKILSPVSGDIFKKYRDEVIESAPAGILHNGTIEASLKSIYEARELNDTIPINNLVTIIYAAIAFVLFVVMSALSGAGGITGAQVFVFQVLWGIIATAVPVLKHRIAK